MAFRAFDSVRGQAIVAAATIGNLTLVLATGCQANCSTGTRSYEAGDHSAHGLTFHCMPVRLVSVTTTSDASRHMASGANEKTAT